MLEDIGAVFMPLLKCIPRLRRYRLIKGKEVAQKMVLVSATKGSGGEEFVLDEIFQTS